MPLTKRKKMRPLGYYIPESRLELQVEKALFKTSMTVLTDLLRQSRMGSESPHPNTPEHQLGLVTARGRQVLSRSEQFDRINNAEYSRYHTPVSDRVVSANANSYNTLYRRNRPMCGRQYELSSPVMSCAHCEVLGQYFCTDCTQLRKRIQSAKKQSVNFPNIDVHPRSLIAPVKVERLLSSDQYGIIKKQKFNDTGVSYEEDNIRFINSPFVYTQNDVYERLRLQHRENGNSVFGKAVKVAENKPDDALSREVTRLRRELTDISPSEMKVTVTFSNQ